MDIRSAESRGIIHFSSLLACYNIVSLLFRIVEIGTTHGIRPGDFFGPVSAAHCLKEALQAAVELNQIPDTFRIYISQDAISKILVFVYAYINFIHSVYRQDVIDLCKAPPNLIKKNSLYPTYESLTTNNENNSSTWLTSILILVPLRLGLNELDLVYEPYLKEALKLTQTVGIIGGSPRHAVYILGFQDESFIDLDPHFSQASVNVLEDTFELSVREKLFIRICQIVFYFFRVIPVRHPKN